MKLPGFLKNRRAMLAVLLIGILLWIIFAFGQKGIAAYQPFFNKFRKHPKPITSVIALDQRTVNLADTSDGHFLKITVAVEVVSTKDSAEMLNTYKIPFLDCVVSVSSKYGYFYLLTPKGKENLKKEMLSRFNEILSDTGWTIKEVYFTDFVME